MPCRVNRTKSSGKPPARRKATKAKTAADAATEPKQTATRARSRSSRARSAAEEPLEIEIEEAAESGTYAPVEAYVPPVMATAAMAPARRRAVLFDVENTSRTQDIEKVLAHLALDFTRGGVEFMAVGNWRVIGHEPARILAGKGAHLIHSAPSTGVRDWSDLRIAVAAGVWIATAQPGDVLEIVSDDQAFEAVGDVAAGRGILFRRVSYRRLAGLPVEAPIPSEPNLGTGDGGRRGRRGRRRSGRRGNGGRGQGAQTSHQAHAPQHHAPARREAAPAGDDVGGEASGVQTAPLDELLDVLHALLARAPQGITLDNLANALKARGFRRRPGSPRLITRLKLIKDIVIDRAGNIRLADGANGTIGGPVRIIHVDEPVSALALEPSEDEDLEGEGDDDTDDADLAGEPTAEAAPAEGGQQNGRRRRRRRGGRRRRGRRGGGGAPVEASSAPVAAPLS
jgi:hypothetical protein